jgi:hypothetical protein
MRPYTITVTAYQSDGLTTTKIVHVDLSWLNAYYATSFKIKASLTKNNTDNTYTLTLRITLSSLDHWLVLDHADIQALKNNIYNQLRQAGLISEDLPRSRISSLVAVVPSDFIDADALELFGTLVTAPNLAYEVWDNIENFGMAYGFILSSFMLCKDKFVPDVSSLPSIVARIINDNVIEPNVWVAEWNIYTYDIPIYRMTENRWVPLELRQDSSFIVGPGQALEIVVKGLKEPPQSSLDLQISMRNSVTVSSLIVTRNNTQYFANPATFSTSITLKKADWWDFLLSLFNKGVGNYYSEEIVVDEYYKTSGAPPALEKEVDVYSSWDIIKNVELKPSAQSIKQGEPLDVSMSFDLDLSIISSLEDVKKPVEVTVELHEDDVFLWWHFSRDLDLPKSTELEPSTSTQPLSFNFRDLRLSNGDHKIYAIITVRYYEGEATSIWGSENIWGTIVVETPRVAVSVGRS